MRLFSGLILSTALALFLTVLLCILSFYSSFFKISISSLETGTKFSTHKIDFVPVFGKFFGEEKKNTFEKAKEEGFPQFLSIPELKAIFFQKTNPLAFLVSKKNQTWVKAGDNFEGWKIKKVGENFVILGYGKYEIRLEIFNHTSYKSTAFSGKKVKVFSYGGIKIQKYGDKRIIKISREEIERLTRNLGVLFSQIGLRPYREGGRFIGLQIRYLAPGSIFSKAGLKVGDILLTFNGIPIETPEDSYKIFEIVRTAPYIEVKVKRGRRILTFRAEIE